VLIISPVMSDKGVLLPGVLIISRVMIDKGVLLLSGVCE